LTEGLIRSSEILLAAGAQFVYADNPIKPVFSSLLELNQFYEKNKNLGPDIIREGNHGMGTCRMDENPKMGVFNSYGRSHDLNNLWIMDISTFPDSLGVNPQITVMAMALRASEYLSGNFS
jgi:choline dehydrogenase-like flavoprotein